MKFLVINGPNINMLGIREKNIYGSGSYTELVEYIQRVSSELGITAEVFQSNHEGAIVDKIQSAYNSSDAIVINPAAYTHTSVAILDALKAVNIPTAEVHLTEPKARESFRHISYVSHACLRTFSGKGFAGYKEAIEFLYNYLMPAEQ